MKSSTAAIPFFLVLVIVAMFVFITFPLTVVGAIIGRNTASDFEAPCRTTRVPRQVSGGGLPYRPDRVGVVLCDWSVWRGERFGRRGLAAFFFGDV